MKVALYARVSTRQHGQDVETQLQALRAHCKQRQWKIVDEYADRGWSGAKERRPELDRLMADGKKKRFDGVLVWRFDRFARSVKHLISALDDFQSWGLAFVSLSESIDTSTPMGKMIFTVLGAVAELERALIRERVQLGVDRAKRDGKRLGRPQRKLDEEGILKVLEKTGSVQETARQFGLPRTTLRRFLVRHAETAQLRGGATDRREEVQEGRGARRRIRRKHRPQRQTKNRG